MASAPTSSPLSLLDRVHRTCRHRQLSRHTEDTYRRWTVRYVHFHGTTPPRTLGAADVRSFLTHLAAERNVAASTQNQARCAVLFLYDDVLDQLQDGENLRRIQELLGHEHLQTTKKYLHVPEQSGRAVDRPLDTLDAA